MDISLSAGNPVRARGAGAILPAVAGLLRKGQKWLARHPLLPAGAILPAVAGLLGKGQKWLARHPLLALTAGPAKLGLASRHNVCISALWPGSFRCSTGTAYIREVARQGKE